MCKKACENEPGCNAIMTTNNRKICQRRKCPIPVIPPDKPYTGPGERTTHYILGNYKKETIALSLGGLKRHLKT